jgi:hypothetical protein
MSRILDLVGSIHRSEEGHALPAVASTIGGVGAILLGIGAATIREHSQSSAVSLRPSAFSAARAAGQHLRNAPPAPDAANSS